MNPFRILTRVIVWVSVAFLIMVFSIFYIVGDINRLKSTVEKKLKDQLNCAVKLGELNWDLNGLKLGVTTDSISVYDLENNIILQGGPTRFVWDVKHIIFGEYAHFYQIDSTELFLKAIRDKKGIWNLTDIFPPGPPPKVDNLFLHNSIVYVIDELNPNSKHLLCKSLNLNFEKNNLTKLRKIDLTSRIGSPEKQSFLKLNGQYTEREKFRWDKSQIDLFLIAKNVELINWQYYFTRFIKDPEVKNVSGDFTGIIHAKKKYREKLISLALHAKTNSFLIDFWNKGIEQKIDIPKTELTLKALIDQDKIHLKDLKSTADELNYRLSGFILNWSKPLPEADLTLKTNRFNFKKVKPYLPISLLPASTRQRIEPINDEGYVEIDLMLNGPIINPKYDGIVLLSDFNLTNQSGFLNSIQGLNGKLTLKDKIMKIDYLNIPIKGSVLSLQGEVDSENFKNSFNITGKKLEITNLLGLLREAGYASPVLDEDTCTGQIDLDLDVRNEALKAPEIMGKLSFYNAGALIYESELLELKNFFGEFLLDGEKIKLNNLSGLINGEGFFIHGDFSLKKDQALNLFVEAKHLKIIPFLLEKLASYSPFQPVAGSVTGEANDLSLNISGSLINPILFGMLSVNNISFKLPKLEDKVSNIDGTFSFEGTDLVVDNLTGKFQNASFAFAGYIENLLASPKLRIRLITGEIEIDQLWNCFKENLAKTSLKEQSEQIENLSGKISTDLFIYPESVLGNIFFSNLEVKHKILPFKINNLGGRLVIGEKNLGLYDLMGSLNGSNNFTSNLTVFNYLNPDFYVQGMLSADVDVLNLLNAFNVKGLDNLMINGVIPSFINFDFLSPNARIYFYSTLEQAFEIEFPPYLKKPTRNDYVLSGDIKYDISKQDILINETTLTSDKLSLIANGSINNIVSAEPELMIHFSTTEPAGLFMIIEPIIPLTGLKAAGMIEFGGLLNGTPSMYSVSAIANLTDVRLPELFGKELTAMDASVKCFLDDMQGILKSKINNLNYVSFMAKSVSLATKYIDPVIYVDELTLDGDPGNVYAVGSYNPVNGQLKLNANGSDIELASLGSFIFLDPQKIAGMTDFVLMIVGAGKTKDEFLSHAEGNLSFSVSDGKMGQVALLHKGLQLANLFGQGIFGFNLRNVLSLFFKYQDGTFENLKGNFLIKEGLIKFNNFVYRAKDLFLNSFGFVDLNNSLINLAFYGYLPEIKKEKVIIETNTNETVPAETVSVPLSGALAVIPDSVGKKRFFIPLLSSIPPQYFKFEVKGNIKEPKKISSKARRSFRWLKGRRLKKEYKYVPK